MNATLHLQANLQWRARQNPDTSRWIGICDPMNLSMEAATLDELHGVINETIQLVLTDLLHDNELDAYLKAHGWTATNLHDVRIEEDVCFDVPWELIADGSRANSERRPH
jgi:hypothetical protein